MLQPSNSSTSNFEPPASRRRLRAVATLIAGALIPLAVCAVLTAFYRQQLVHAALTNAALGTINTLNERVQHWLSEEAHEKNGVPGVVWGDSVFAPFFTGGLQAELARRHMQSDVLDLTSVGLSIYHYYYLLDPVLRGRPQFAVVEVNRRTFADDWRNDPALRFPHLAAWVPPYDAWHARTALAAIGIRPLDAVRYWLLRTSGTLFLADGIRDVVQSANEAAGQWANRVLGLETIGPEERLGRAALAMVLTRERAQARFGQSFAETPTAHVLAMLAQDLRAAGVITLFVVSPVNPTRLAHFGIAQDDLERRSDALRRSIGASPEEWLDATPLVLPADFQDSVHVKRAAVQLIADTAAARLASLLAARHGHLP